MVIEITTDLVFLGIIICFALIGAKKGCIRSLGGLIAAFVSWIISKSFSLPFAGYLFTHFGLDEKINSILAIFKAGLADNAGVFSPAESIGLSQLSGLTSVSNKFNSMISGIVNKSALNVTAMFTSIITFIILTFLFGMILKLFQTAIDKVPMGKFTDSVLGLACGALKGLIVSAVLYIIFYCINTFFHANIPLNETYIGQILELVNKIHF